MNSGEHQCCFCTINTAGDIVCCHCGRRLEKLYDQPDVVVMWEKMGHDKRLPEQLENYIGNAKKQNRLL